MHGNALILSSFLLATFLWPSTSESSQEYSYHYAFLSHIEGEVTLQRAAEPEPEPGAINVPILPGDRIWTDAASRAEVRFADETLLRLSQGTKVDFVDLEDEILFRVWSGSALLKTTAESRSVRIDSPAGIVRPTAAGTYRIDVQDGQSVTLSVGAGSAELASHLGAVLLQSGETSSASVDRPPDVPRRFNTARFDEFDAWSDERDRRASYTRDIVVRSLPREIHVHAQDLGHHGEWAHDPTYGTVWYPQVSAGWAPYTYGRWSYTRFGHTWVSYEPWGWAPYHYGRWGHGHRGWYWIPGATWGPAWVSFALGPFWVGWSPLGFHDRPVFRFDAFLHGPRHRRPFHHRGGWSFVERDHFGSYRAARLDDRLVRSSGGTAQILDGGAVLGRDLTPRRAVPRESVSMAGGGRAGAARPSVGRLTETRSDVVSVPRATTTSPSRILPGSRASSGREVERRRSREPEASGDRRALVRTERVEERAGARAPILRSGGRDRPGTASRGAGVSEPDRRPPRIRDVPRGRENDGRVEGARVVPNRGRTDGTRVVPDRGRTDRTDAGRRPTVGRATPRASAPSGRVSSPDRGSRGSSRGDAGVSPRAPRVRGGSSPPAGRPGGEAAGSSSRGPRSGASDRGARSRPRRQNE